MNRRAVYVIEHPEALAKVGLTRNPCNRLDQLQATAGATLQGRVIFPVTNGREGHALECAAHAILRDCRLVGDWHRCTVAEAIAAVERAAVALGIDTAPESFPAPMPLRDRLERAVEAAIDALDAFDGSADTEPDGIEDYGAGKGDYQPVTLHRIAG